MINGFQIVSEAIHKKDSDLIVSVGGKIIRGPLAATISALRSDIKHNRKIEVQLKDLYKRVRRSKAYGDPVRTMIFTRLRNVKRRLVATIKELRRIKNRIQKTD